MFSSEEKEIISKAIDTAADWINTPAWNKRAKAMCKVFPDGEWDPKELDFVLTVITEGRWNYGMGEAAWMNLDLAKPLRDRLRAAA